MSLFISPRIFVWIQLRGAAFAMIVRRIVSGGQTGVDRAALDFAIDRGIPCGGWCPQGRWAEDGVIDPRFPLIETPSSDPAERTEWNVRDSDGTLVILCGTPIGGTKLTIEIAKSKHQRPIHVVDLADKPAVEAIRRWIERWRIAVLNVAGPRESQAPGIYLKAYSLLVDVGLSR